MIRKVVTVVALVIGVSGTAARGDYRINKDFVNTTRDTAHALVVRVEGTPQIGRFVAPPFWESRSDTVGQGGNTVISFSRFDDGAVKPNDTIHIGWCQPTWPQVLDVCWGDKWGYRIGSNRAHQVTCKIVEVGGLSAHNVLGGVSFHNVFAPFGIPEPTMTVRDVQFVMLATPIPLDSLNRRNRVLDSLLLLQPLPGGEEIILPFDQPVPIPFPTPIPPGYSVVLRYSVTGPGSSAQIIDYVEVTPGGTIPTLSEWGAIIFGTLLLASVAFYIWRKRRVVTA